MNKLYFALAFAFVLTLAGSCATTGPGCDEPVLANSADAEPADDSDDPCPAGLSCNEHGGCNSARSASEAP